MHLMQHSHNIKLSRSLANLARVIERWKSSLGKTILVRILDVQSIMAGNQTIPRMMCGIGASDKALVRLESFLDALEYFSWERCLAHGVIGLVIASGQWDDPACGKAEEDSVP